jgi:nicotinamidase-related amidase
MQKRYWEWRRPFSWEPERAALLIIDMQEGFLAEGATLEVPMARSQVPTIARLQQAFRDRGLAVVHTRFVVKSDAFVPFYRSIAEQRGLDALSPASPFAAHAPDAAITPPLSARPGEPVIDKVAYDGFADTELELVLRSQGIETLIFAGTVVNWCVDSTLRSAFHRRFNSIVVADGVSGYDHAGATGDQWVRQSLDHFAEAFAVVMDSADIISALDDPSLRKAGQIGHPAVVSEPSDERS